MLFLWIENDVYEIKAFDDYNIKFQLHFLLWDIKMLTKLCHNLIKIIISSFICGLSTWLKHNGARCSGNTIYCINHMLQKKHFHEKSRKVKFVKFQVWGIYLCSYMFWNYLFSTSMNNGALLWWWILIMNWKLWFLQIYFDYIYTSEKTASANLTSEKSHRARRIQPSLAVYIYTRSDT